MESSLIKRVQHDGDSINKTMSIIIVFTWVILQGFIYFKVVLEMLLWAVQNKKKGPV